MRTYDVVVRCRDGSWYRSESGLPSKAKAKAAEAEVHRGPWAEDDATCIVAIDIPPKESKLWRKVKRAS